ncbi:MAG: hypothetical protein K8S54_03635 [Spirochaetia bacterium]|nr:hypothetical protein [Spirochaetia bacterium]
MSNGTLLLNEADTNVTWAGVYLLHSMEDLGPVDPRNVPTLFQLIAHPGLLGTAARLFQDRYGYSAQDREPWASNQPRPEKVSDPFVASANKEFLNLACACLLRAFGFRSLDKYFRNQNEAIVFAADAYMVDRLLAVESGIFPDSALRTVALEFALLFARGFIWADPGEYPSGQQRVLRIVERIEKQGITIPENDPFWRTLCLGAALWSDHFDWNHAARSNRELFEAFAVTEVRE